MAAGLSPGLAEYRCRLVITIAAAAAAARSLLLSLSCHIPAATCHPPTRRPRLPSGCICTGTANGAGWAAAVWCGHWLRHARCTSLHCGCAAAACSACRCAVPWHTCCAGGGPGCSIGDAQQGTTTRGLACDARMHHPAFRLVALTASAPHPPYLAPPCCSPLLSETSPANVRGLLISLKEAFIVGGILAG